MGLLPSAIFRVVAILFKMQVLADCIGIFVIYSNSNFWSSLVFRPSYSAFAFAFEPISSASAYCAFFFLRFVLMAMYNSGAGLLSSASDRRLVTERDSHFERPTEGKPRGVSLHEPIHPCALARTSTTTGSTPIPHVWQTCFWTAITSPRRGPAVDIFGRSPWVRGNINEFIGAVALRSICTVLDVTQTCHGLSVNMRRFGYKSLLSKLFGPHSDGSAVSVSASSFKLVNLMVPFDGLWLT